MHSEPNDTTHPAGATRAEWQHFSEALGLTADLLPVVSDQTVPISGASKITALGKTPSRINGSGEAVGIPSWTRLQTSAAEVESWSLDDRLGICLQTRRIRAIDIDIGDPVAAQRVVDLIELTVGALPRRMRSNSGKCLLVFELAGDYSKRVIKTPAGAIEFLATGQQCVVAGTHPSGARYEWPGGLPDAIPALPAEEFEGLWAGLSTLGTATETRTGAAPTSSRKAADSDDPMVPWLDANGWVREFDTDGRVHVRCPWEHEHTTDTGPSSTTYFPAGVGGIAHGNFRCLHAHCSGRNRGEFSRAVGYDDPAGEFEVVAPAPSAPDVLPAFDRTPTGKIKPTRGNLDLALSRSHLVGAELRYDTFHDTLMICWGGDGAWRPIKDVDYTRLCKVAESGLNGFAHIPRDLMRDMVHLVADREHFDSAQRWLDGLKWDGVPRVGRFLTKYLDAQDTEYTRAVSLYLWTALAGRVIEPGVKADMVTVLVGPQGAGKSSIASAIAPTRDAFLELDLGRDEADQAREMRGKLVIELGELKGLRAREKETLKSFIARRVDEWTPKYQEHATRYARRSVFIGTTNEREFLSDDTGERRWLPVDVPMRTPADVGAAVDAVTRDREQLWAEGAVLFRAGGVAWQDAERLAAGEHVKFKAIDEWTDAVASWLARDDMDDTEGTPRGDRGVTTHEVLQSAIGIPLDRINDAARKRAAGVLRGLGFRDVRSQTGGQRTVRFLRVPQ